MNTLLDRFCRYVRIDTQADEKATTYPSSVGQLEMGRLLVQELQAMGLRDAAQDAHGIVLATIPATRRGRRRPSPGSRTSIRRRKPAAATSSRSSTAITTAATSCCPATRPGDSRRGQSRTGRTQGQDHRHHRRHHAARGRRQGRRRGHHGSGRPPGGPSGDCRTARSASASPATRRSATASIMSI